MPLDDLELFLAGVAFGGLIGAHLAAGLFWLMLRQK